ncbi:MAG: site-specific DNA-methyltransferase [Eubacteriales bacterium]|nr:site-specific DNA-methyltransferase [Eubacteriales bacterium]
MKRKSKRNKTLDLPLSAGGAYLKELVRFTSTTDVESLRNRMTVGDAFAVMAALPAACADLIIVDPPYNLTKDYHGRRFGKRKAADYAAFTERWLAAAVPLLKPGGTMYVCCDWATGIILAPILEKYLQVRNRITWQREKGRGAKTNWKNGMEDIWYCTKGKPTCFNLAAVRIRRRVEAPYRADGEPKDWRETASGRFRDTCPSNFWDDVTVPFWSMAENTAHPTQKPEKLLAKLILASSNPGDLVFDPFAGSGSTGVTAKKLGRDFIQVEQNEQYCLWGQIRLQRAETDRRIQGFEDGIFRARNM